MSYYLIYEYKNTGYSYGPVSTFLLVIDIFLKSLIPTMVLIRKLYRHMTQYTYILVLYYWPSHTFRCSVASYNGMHELKICFLYSKRKIDNLLSIS